MIAEGVTFDHWEAPPLNPTLSVLYLRQVELPQEAGVGQNFVLLISDSPDLPNVLPVLDDGERA